MLIGLKYLIPLTCLKNNCDLDLSTFGSDGMEDALFYDDVDEPNVEWNQRNEQDVLDLDFQEPNMVNIARRQLIPGKEHHNHILNFIKMLLAVCFIQYAACENFNELQFQELQVV